jgi:hypothetical protein
MEKQSTCHAKNPLNVREGFCVGLQVARAAARMLFRARKLLLVIALLGAFEVLGGVVAVQFHSALYPASPVRAAHPKEGLSPIQIWLDWSHDWYTPGFLIEHFDAPEYSAANAASVLVGMLIDAVTVKSVPDQEAPSWASHLEGWLFLISVGVVLSAGNIVIIAWMLGWLSDLARGMQPRCWWDYLRLHYFPLLAFFVTIDVACDIASFWAQQLDYLVFSYHSATQSWFSRILFFILSELPMTWLLPIVFLLFIFVPYAIVGRNLGAWGGVKSSVLVFLDKKWALLPLFLIYRVIEEVMIVVVLSFPSRLYVQIHPHAGWLTTHWLLQFAAASLGMWLAMCFTLLVVSNKPPIAAKDG